MHANQFLSFIVSVVNCSAIHVYQIVSYVSLLTIKLIDFLFFFLPFFSNISYVIMPSMWNVTQQKRFTA